MIKNKPELQEDLKLDLKKGRFRRMRALVVKECFQIIRDPSSIFISIFLPLMLIFLFGSGLSLDLDHLKVGLVMEDTSPDAQSFAETLIASPYFDVKITRDRHALEDDLTSGRIRGFFVIPSYFSNFRARPEIIAPIQVIADGSETNTANFMQNYALGALQIWLKEQVITSGETTQERPIINIESRFWYNEELESRFFLLSGSLAIIMTLIGALLT
ncbi:MAG: ABC transporter permease, partial [Simkaniaceae bacterium]|nr:ABC transporter permease [Simkaniaceae bacterium]